MDAADQVAQLGEGLLGALVRGVDQRGSAVTGVAVGQFARAPCRAACASGDELGLGAVVQVALDAAQPGAESSMAWVRVWRRRLARVGRSRARASSRSGSTSARATQGAASEQQQADQAGGE